MAGTLLQIVQVIIGLILIIAIMFSTTKSESSSGMGGMGWGAIGGKTSSTLGRFGSEEQIGRITTWVAVSFLVISMLTAIVYTRISG